MISSLRYINKNGAGVSFVREQLLAVATRCKRMICTFVCLAMYFLCQKVYRTWYAPGKHHHQRGSKADTVMELCARLKILYLAFRIVYTETERVVARADPRRQERCLTISFVWLSYYIAAHFRMDDSVTEVML